jgi:predicted enzyme related to lactoylglutathione lyase
MLRLVARAPIGRPNEAWGGAWDVFFWARGIDALAAAFKDAGADIVYGPLLEPGYGMREFAVRDPAGYVIGFGEEAANPRRESDGLGG